MITVTDAFCGCGGETAGFKKKGFVVVLAINHNKVAILTHSTNHPETDHACEDLQEEHPSRYPRTDVLIASPECTKHSQAAGRKRKGLSQVDFITGKNGINPEDEKSRVTMDWVVKATSYHKYDYVVCENVLEVRDWHGYQSWWHSMLDLGYEGQSLSLNSMFFGVPQSRDRWYAVFWRKGMKKPNLEFKPAAYCSKCERQVEAIQSWKNTEKPWGRYGKAGQYWYRCPHCAEIVEPPTVPAAQIIDWTNLGEPIGERKEPLVESTLNRIRAGLRKFAESPGGFIAPIRGTAIPFDTAKPLSTITTAQQHALIVPQRRAQATSPEQPLSTITGSQQHALIISYYSRDDAFSSVSEPLPVIPTQNRHYLLDLNPFLSVYNGSGDGQPTSVNHPMWTISTRDRHALIVPQQVAGSDRKALIEKMLMGSLYRLLQPLELKLGMGFPKPYIILGAKYQQVKQIGNAWTPPVAEGLAERILEAYRVS